MGVRRQDIWRSVGVEDDSAQLRLPGIQLRVTRGIKPGVWGVGKEGGIGELNRSWGEDPSFPRHGIHKGKNLPSQLRWVTMVLPGGLSRSDAFACTGGGTKKNAHNTRRIYVAT